MIGMFKIWIDDLRTPPDETWHWAKSVHEAKLRFIQLGGLNEKPGIVSLDHDAAEYAFMGGDFIEFLKWIEKKYYEDNKTFDNIYFHLHTGNAVGRENMKAIIQHNHWNNLEDVDLFE